jgi:hypothetical protein
MALERKEMSTAIKPTPGSVQRDSQLRIPDPTPTEIDPALVPTAQDTNRRTAELAYRIWQKRGCPDGEADEIWFEAEQSVRRG